MEAAARAAAAARHAAHASNARAVATSCAAPGRRPVGGPRTISDSCGRFACTSTTSVVEPKKKAQGVAAPSPLPQAQVAQIIKFGAAGPRVVGVSHQKGAGTVDVVAMQERDVHDAIRRARSQGTGWLFHIDDDELLHLTSANLEGRARESR